LNHLVRHLHINRSVFNYTASAARTCTRLASLVALSCKSENDHIMEQNHPVLWHPEVWAVKKYESQVRVQHWQIYGQLAGMVNLNVLELGIEFRDIHKTKVPTIQRDAQSYIDYGGPFPATLELSLASGWASCRH
ncbi:hypothetical protein BGX29_006741, partial [Mortierella sp. GBA35]